LFLRPTPARRATKVLTARPANVCASHIGRSTPDRAPNATGPVKIRLVDANGVNVSAAGVVVHALSVTQISINASVVLDDSGGANPDFDFRFDPTLEGGGYVFNLKTTGYGTGTHLLNFVVGGDPVVHSVQFQVRQ
jgi:hypothetical protein